MRAKVVYILSAFIVFGLIVQVIATKKHIEPVLVVDREYDNTFPKEYRVYAGLNSSASGQFTEAELLNLKKVYPDKEIAIVDLRQESHGFVNGMPVTWYSFQNNINENKTNAQIIKDELYLLDSVKDLHTVMLNKPMKDSSGQVFSGGKFPVKVDLVETERQLVERHGLKYFRFFILDHHKPIVSEVDAFIKFINDHDEERLWLHFHCRGGRGRSTLFMAMYDIMRNAENLGLNDIIQRQIEFGGIDLSQHIKSENKQWKSKPAKDRYLFLKDFYSYVKDKNGLADQSFSAWKQARGS